MDLFIKSGFFADMAYIGYQLIILILILALGAAMLWVLTAYKHRAIIINKNGRMRFDRVREWTDKEGKKRRKLLFKHKETIPETEDDEAYIVGRNNGYLFYQTSKDNYIPLRLDFTVDAELKQQVALRSVDTDVDWWAINLYADKEAQYASNHFWERFGGAITLGVIVVFVFMMVWFTLDYSEAVIGQVNSQIGPLVDRLGEIAQSLKNLNTQTIPSLNQ